MCLIAFAIDSHPKYRLIMVANRDEYRNRETAPAGYWSAAPHLLAGRDQQAGGTWLGVTTGGKLAAITNYRDARQQVINPPSRGSLVSDYLCDNDMTPAELQAYLVKNGNRYDGFNLLYGSCSELHYFTNRGGSSGPVKPGIHSLSNHLLDTHWPKVVAAKERLTHQLQNPEPTAEELLSMLSDREPFAHDQLPDTGIGPERERFLSPIFINGDTYCTRSTTVIMVGNDDQVTYIEQGHDTPLPHLQRFTFQLSPEGRT
ncbi:MAG: NRDE family protein [Geobacteraceae bacterium]|nr:NRDE family protein [Geobacteraceae bacterium]NTW78841.1 NRDE family protein [Geobacteraceae bacterium]